MKVFYPVTEVPAKGAGRKKNTKEVDMVDKMFSEIAPKYADRNGGYTRIVKIGQRKGDCNSDHFKGHLQKCRCPFLIFQKTRKNA